MGTNCSAPGSQSHKSHQHNFAPEPAPTGMVCSPGVLCFISSALNWRILVFPFFQFWKFWERSLIGSCYPPPSYDRMTGPIETWLLPFSHVSRVKWKEAPKVKKAVFIENGQGLGRQRRWTRKNIWITGNMLDAEEIFYFYKWSFVC